MRRIWIAVLMTLLLLLCACGSRGNDGLQAAMDLRSSLLENDGCGFTAQLRADVGGRMYDFVLDCDVKADGSAALTVQSPETLEGVTAALKGRGGSLSFDGVSFDLGLFPGSELAPLEIPVVTVDGWLNAYIASAGGDEGRTQVTYEGTYGNTAYTLDTWLDAAGRPTQAELALNGKVVAVMRLDGFALNGG